jgi:hypothetical protein
MRTMFSLSQKGPDQLWVLDNYGYSLTFFYYIFDDIIKAYFKVSMFLRTKSLFFLSLTYWPLFVRLTVPK